MFFIVDNLRILFKLTYGGKMAIERIRVLSCLAFISAMMMQFISADHPTSSTIPEHLKDTDPFELNKIVFQPLLSKRYGNLGLLLYDLFTDENALGKQLSEISGLIANRINFENYEKDMKLILHDAVSPALIKRIQNLYNSVKDITVEGKPDESLEKAVEIIRNILSNNEAVDEIDSRIKNIAN